MGSNLYWFHMSKFLKIIYNLKVSRPAYWAWYVLQGGTFSSIAKEAEAHQCHDLSGITELVHSRVQRPVWDLDCPKWPAHSPTNAYSQDISWTPGSSLARNLRGRPKSCIFHLQTFSFYYNHIAFIKFIHLVSTPLETEVERNSNLSFDLIDF